MTYQLGSTPKKGEDINLYETMPLLSTLKKEYFTLLQQNREETIQHLEEQRNQKKKMRAILKHIGHLDQSGQLLSIVSSSTKDLQEQDHTLAEKVNASFPAIKKALHITLTQKKINKLPGGDIQDLITTISKQSKETIIDFLLVNKTSVDFSRILYTIGYDPYTIEEMLLPVRYSSYFYKKLTKLIIQHLIETKSIMPQQSKKSIWKNIDLLYTTQTGTDNFLAYKAYLEDIFDIDHDDDTSWSVVPASPQDVDSHILST